MKLSFCVLILLSLASISFSLDCKPRQIHLALGDAYYYSSQDQSTVHRPNAANHHATLIYHTNDYCGSSSVTILNKNLTINATRVTNFTDIYKNKLRNSKDPYKSHIYTVYIYDLQPEVIYDYQITSNGVKSDKYSFQVPKTSKSGANTATKVLFIGDMDMDSISGDTWARIRGRINSKDFTSYDAFIHLGDMAYNLEGDGGKRGDYFMENMTSIAAWMPYMFIPGNHETKSNYSNFVNRIRMPLWEKTQNHMYSMNIGLVHFSTFNFDLFKDNKNLQAGMLKWLEADLKKANENRDKWPWVVVINHRPLYCSNVAQYSTDCVSNWKTFSAIDDLLYKYKVDLYINGHSHSYERSYPVYQAQVFDFDKVPGDKNLTYIKNPKATVHIVEAIAGNVEDHGLKQYSPLKYTVKNSIITGYGHMVAHNRTHLQYTHFISKTNEVFDDFYIIKDKQLSLDEEYFMTIDS